MAHSLVKDHMELLQAVADGTFRIKTIKNTQTGEHEQRLLIELPPEEAFESFAARLRPFTIRDEVVYWELVLDSVEGLVPPATLEEVIDIAGLRQAWAGVTQDRKSAQAYAVVTENGQLTDKELAHDWLNSDALHAQAISSAVGKDLDLDHRYQAAAGVYARLGAAVNATYNVVSYLVAERLLDLDESAFTERVTAETSIDEQLVGGYMAPAGSTPIPTDLVDVANLDAAWTPVHEEFEQIIRARKQAEADAAVADNCLLTRGSRGVRMRWPDGRETTANWSYQA